MALQSMEVGGSSPARARRQPGAGRPSAVLAPPAPIVVPVPRLGIDLVAVEEVAEAVARHGDRYLRRIYTDHELASCQGANGRRMESLAARFAAKEAALKVLRPVGARPPWRDIEVRRGANGACELKLYGSAASAASAQGLQELSVSLTHHAGLAVAAVVGLCLPRPGPEAPDVG